jgi:hypothetical protein
VQTARHAVVVVAVVKERKLSQLAEVAQTHHPFALPPRAAQRGKRMASSTAIIAITTSNSTSVNPERLRPLLGAGHTITVHPRLMIGYSGTGHRGARLPGT